MQWFVLAIHDAAKDLEVSRNQATLIVLALETSDESIIRRSSPHRQRCRSESLSSRFFCILLASSILSRRVIIASHFLLDTAARRHKLVAFDWQSDSLTACPKTANKHEESRTVGGDSSWYNPSICTVLVTIANLIRRAWFEVNVQEK